AVVRSSSITLLGSSAEAPSSLYGTLWHSPTLSKAARERWTGPPRGSEVAGEVTGLAGISGGRIMSIEHVENLVIGSGVTGKILGGTWGGRGKKPVVVERGRVGGSCLTVACLPSKNFIYSARAVSLAHPTRGLGVVPGWVRVDMAGVARRKRQLVAELVE